MDNKYIEEVNVGPIKCDAEGCDYTEQVAPEDYTKYINKPCPKCGANLLTYDDYMRFKASMDAIDLVNSMTEEQLKEFNSIMAGIDQADEIKKMLEGFGLDDLVKVSVSIQQ